ncbi:hypothetical protein A2311_03950 [candidate division WOR-1 bacterium RIFOXYB2_FULL_48_7]|uniref:Uncharacterized protein n=1 Tax=candidate division WOR-1 bacterium RIFOXYB2_FULL_48_7 TaxID=1802583 RepID=A0A1F4TMY9_UNCSA|nr:MAG: hypothetical protein A2311_03950 [candidate division WOR-1 bacterium RIFOXYB2_FULL_48_7]
MELKEVNAIIKVGAVFRGSNIQPQWFIWENRKYQIKEINYTWRDRRGAEELFCFAVTDDINNYEISFNAKRVNWLLDKVCTA